MGDIDRNVLKDLTGNGHDITLNNFAYSGMSGYGGYVLSIPEIEHDGDHVVYSNYMKFKIISSTFPLHSLIFRWKGQNKRNTFKLKVKYNNNNCRLYFGKAGAIGTNKNESILLKDGINEIPYFTWSETENNWEGIMAVDDSNLALPVNTPLDVDVEFLSEYPDALVFDGVDDYGVNENIPTLTDYTIIAKRKLLGENIQWLISKRIGDYWGAFNFEYRNNNIESVRSFGNDNILNLTKGDISWQTKNFYNQKNIVSGEYEDTNEILIGAGLKNQAGVHEHSNITFYSAYLFDRSLDDQEIKSFIRKHIDPEYLLPSETAPTPDVYYDFTNEDNSKGEANNVIKDLSGNAMDATAHNFAWNEESGYAGGGLKFDGVDDYITLNNTNNTKVYYRTVIGVVTVYNNNESMLYNQRAFDIQAFNGALLYSGVLYYARNNVNKEKCLTYINGKLNDANFGIQSLTAVNKKHCFAVTFNDTEFNNVRKDFIRISSTAANNFYINMNMYKFMAFKDRLTEEQIKTVINKYNLLDGVDNIN